MFVQLASPIFTITEISNPSWSLSQWNLVVGLQGVELKMKVVKSVPLIISIVLHVYPYPFGPVEPLDLSLGSLPSSQQSGHFASDVDEPLKFGLSSLHFDHEDEYLTEDDGISGELTLMYPSEYNFGLSLNDEEGDGMYATPVDQNRAICLSFTWPDQDDLEEGAPHDADVLYFDSVIPDGWVELPAHKTDYLSLILVSKVVH
ncbi:hypothetical protein P692DRAFT_20819964 [Suillus brevipes Sb2]|nr:hypothetical protein P692DRAFT_20819964 [Suillus brevipes Sb2]